MRKYGKWALTLGLLAATPAFTSAATPPARNDEQPAAKRPAKSHNQQMAERIAAALKAEKLSAFDVEIEFKDGTAIIKGAIADKKQKMRARQAISKVAGVTQIDDSALHILAKKSFGQRMSAKPQGGVVQAGGEHDVQKHPVQQVSHEESSQAMIQNNQQVADQIGAALSGARLDGYDIEIRYQNGVVMLEGRVPTNAQKVQATQVASSVPGVMSVANRLQVTEEPAAPERPAGPPMGYDPRMMQGGGPMGPGMMQGPGPMGPGMMGGPGPMGPGMGPGGPMGPGMMPQGGPMGYDPRQQMLANGVDPRMIPAGYPGQGPEMGPPPGMPGAPVPPPAPYGQPGPGMSPATYSMPGLPEHAWPSYAQYPNSAAVSYPQQYSASAWPYIGPFYPYPQVPLGWRDATLRWDDGQWNLQFRQRTDKWFWFLHPKNW